MSSIALKCAHARAQIPLIAMALCWACGPTSGEAPFVAAPAMRRQQLNHTPLKAAAAERMDGLDGDHMLDLRISLGVRDEAGLNKLLAEQQDPASSHYHEYLTPEAFAARFHPEPAHVAQVTQALRDNGIDVDGEPHGLVLHARAKAKHAEAFFDTRIYHYRTAQGDAFHAPAHPISVPGELDIQAVRGLCSPPKSNPNYQLRNKAHWASAAPTYNAERLRRAYNVPSDLLGDGRRLSLIELDGYDPTDVQAYAQINHLRAVPLNNILVDGFDGQVHDAGAQVEVTMDIELMNAMAPNAQEIRVYEASNAGSGFFDIFNELANPTLGDRYLARIISCSWGVAEDETTQADVQAEAALFKQMAAQGQTVFSASGDNGARDDGSQLSVDDPASQPYVVGVGGTTLFTSYEANYMMEKAWSNGGGGISAYWPIPEWQAPWVRAASGSSTTQRNVPDVALNADPQTGYVVYVAGVRQTVGGTSCAAPLWAAFMGLGNQARQRAGLPPLGFLSPRLYSLAGSAQAQSMFHDIADGSSNGFYATASGYDNATGLGSFQAAALIEALASQP